MNRPLWQAACAAVVLAVSGAAQVQRGIALPPNNRAPAANGGYFALIIGINQYQHWPQLRTAANDARSLDEVLRQRYGFQTTLLSDSAATRANILNAFADYRRRLHENDNLLIYYAGHGTRDGGKAYWLPVDSSPDSTANWIIADDVTNGVSVIPARHILIISDSCYSGGISRDARANTAPTEHDSYIQTMLSAKSRVLISSGRDEPVADGGSGGHSVFANAVLNGLSHPPDQTFTAFNLFSRYIQESVVGGSSQVPLYQMIQNSGHEYGDFVFVARGGVVPSSPLPGVTPPSSPADRHPPAEPSTPARPSTTRLAADGRTASAPPADAGGAVPLTDYRVALLEFRDSPDRISDAAMYDIAKWQVIGEQSNWKLLDAALAAPPPPGTQLNPQRSQFIFEWQKYIDSNPQFAAASLLPVFMRADADWSFLKKEKSWDEQFDAYVYVFLFDREKIQGRQPDFVARELAPIVKKHLQLAIAKAATHLYFDIRLQTAYDVASGSIRFQQPNGQFADSLELLLPTPNVMFASGPVANLPPPTEREYRNILPPQARGMALYNRSLAIEDVPTARPGIIVYGADPQEVWRKSITGNTQDMKMLSLGAFALDRQLKLSAIPLDPRKAEPLFQALRNLRARVFFTADRTDLFALSYERKVTPQAVLFGRVQKIEILGPKNELIATVPAASLPQPAAK